MSQWPEGGPKRLWTIEGLGEGFSSVSIVDGRLFTMGDRAGPDEKKSNASRPSICARERNSG
jgi:hypothetical protein